MVEAVEMVGEEKTVLPAKGLVGTCDVPGDPEISVMALGVAARAEGQSEIVRCSRRPDVVRMVNAMSQLGISCAWEEETVAVTGGLLQAPEAVLEVGDSAVLLGCLAGLLAGASLSGSLVGEACLAERVKPVVAALQELGAQVSLSSEGVFPVVIEGGVLKPGVFRAGDPDAAVKCAVLMAGLGVEGVVELLQNTSGDDDLEVLFKAAGVFLDKGRVEGEDGYRYGVNGPVAVQVACHELPGDADAALFLILAAALLKRSELVLEGVGVDWKTRRMMDLLRRMNVSFKMEKTRTKSRFASRTVTVKSGELRPVKVAGSYSALFRDVLPLFAVAGACTPGETIIRDAQALREGEKDCIARVVENLRNMQIQVGEMPDGLVVKGGRLQGAEVDAGGDARVGLAFVLAGLVAEGETVVRNPGDVEGVFPGILDRLEAVVQR
ncbi:MAG: hypothetical protein O2954_07935 [bacterium]|nr:hypothetical protein [bacterium]